MFADSGESKGRKITKRTPLPRVRSTPGPPTFHEQMRPTLLSDVHPHNPLAQSTESAIMAKQTPKQVRNTFRRTVEPSARHEARLLWRAAAPLFGKSPDSEPPVAFVTNQRVTPKRWADTQQVGTKNPYVEMPAEYADYLSDEGYGGRHASALRILLHEWAHYHQKGAPGGESARARSGGLNPVLEGGAEAFTGRNLKRVLKAAGISLADYERRGTYQPFVRRIRKTKSNEWIDQGQFKP